jgi:hypothetical protein
MVLSWMGNSWRALFKKLHEVAVLQDLLAQRPLYETFLPIDDADAETTQLRRRMM